MQEQNTDSFEQFSLAESLLNELAQKNFKIPTDIQQKAIPEILNGEDIFAQAKTGSGKTGAFVIPIINNILSKNLKNDEGKGPLYIVLSPTRELAQQIHSVFEDFGQKIGISSIYIIGGEEYKNQKDKLEKGIDVVIATPGRLIDLYKQRSLNFENIVGLVLDETDRLFDMGFQEDIKYILKQLPLSRQIMMFSATNHFDVLTMAYNFKAQPKEIALDSDENILVDAINHSVIHVGDNEKVPLLAGIFKKEKHTHSIIFCNTKSETHTLAKWLQNLELGFNIKAISGKLPQDKRSSIVNDFRKKNINILVSTDVAARGLDIDNVNLVINYDLPQDPCTYVHRVGRTGRAGLSGKAISFCSFQDCGSLELIEEYIKNKINVVNIEESLLETNVGRRPITDKRVKNMREANGNTREVNGNTREENTNSGEKTNDRNNRNNRNNRNDRNNHRNTDGREGNDQGRDRSGHHHKDRSRREYKNNNFRPRNEPIVVTPTKSRNNFEITSYDYQEAASKAMKHLMVDGANLLEHSVLEKKGDKFFGLLGKKATTYNFFVTPKQDLLSRHYIDKILELVKLDLSYKIELSEKSLLIDFVGTDEDALTKNAFELLQSIELCLKKYLAKRIVTFPGFIVRLSCNGVSNSKQVELEKLAQELRDKVVKQQKSFSFNTLGPKDRRVIHQFFSEDNEVRTDSIGKGYYKRIQLSLK